ncbi:MAG: MFS transporter, partial [Deltaproteobacteria bacterium]
QFVGIIAAMALSPLLTTAHGIAGMLVSYGIASGAVALAFCVLMKENPLAHSAEKGSADHFRFFEGIRKLFRNRDMLLMLLLFFIGLGMFNAVTTWIEQILHPRGFNAEQAGAVGAIMMVAGIVGAILFPVFSDRLRKRKGFLILAMAGSFPGLAGIAFAHSFLLLALSAAVFGLFFMSAGPIGYQYSAEISFPIPEATSQGLIVLAGQLSGIIFIFGMDALKNAKTGDMTTFMILFIVLSFVNLLITILVKESKMIQE